MNALKKPFSEKENLIVSSNCSLQDNNNPKMFFPWSGVPQAYLHKNKTSLTTDPEYWVGQNNIKLYLNFKITFFFISAEKLV